MSSTQTILLTGISGFLGSSIAHKLLLDGYRVRGVVRSAKLELVKDRYRAYGEKVEIVVVEDLVHGSFKDVLKGIDGVIHAAAPLPGRSASNEEALEVSIEGSINILRQTEQAGIKNFVFISSILAASDFSTTAPVSDKNWVPITREQAVSKDASPGTTYVAQKALSERAVWDFADQHPHVEISSINPGYIIGPFAPEFNIPDAKRFSLSTNSKILDLLTPEAPVTFAPTWVDPRDVATASVLALRAPPASEVGRKRFIMLADDWVSAKDVVAYIAEVRPELKDRLAKAAWEAPPAPTSFVDANRVKEVLNFQYTSWKPAMIGAVDSIVAFEQEWKKNGLVID